MGKKITIKMSRWILDEAKNKQLWLIRIPYWKCENCGKGSHRWDTDSLEPQWVQCPDCKAIMMNKEVVSR